MVAIGHVVGRCPAGLVLEGWIGARRDEQAGDFNRLLTLPSRSRRACLSDGAVQRR